MPKLLYANTRDKNMRYVAGMDILDPFFFLETKQGQYIFLDQREFGIFQEKNKNNRIEPVLLRPPFLLPNELALHIIEQHSLRKEAITVSSSFPLGMADFLREKGTKLVPTHPLFPERSRKSIQEMQFIKESIQKTEKALALIEEILKASSIQGTDLMYEGKVLTSEFLKEQVELLLLKEGMANEEGIIISSGAQAAIPHHSGQGPLKAFEPIVCDIFPKHRETGYFADLTRTFVKGEPSSAVGRMIEAVTDAQEAVINALRHGVKGSDIHQLCSEVLLEKGFHAGEKGFTHGTGHGVGLDVHEAPALSAASKDMLESGNIVTVEPGLYYPGERGVRVEDMVLVTAKGCERLSTYPKNWCIV